MKKNLISVIFICVIVPVIVQAQKLPTIFSETMPGMEVKSKVILLKNGNTGLLQFTKKGETYFTLFDKAKKKIKDGMVQFTVVPERIDKCAASAIFGANNDVLFFLIAYNRKTKAQSFYRIIFDGTTGALKKEELLADAFPSFVTKDPNSEYYAIGYATGSKDAIKREVVHYSPSNQEINRVQLEIPQGNYKIYQSLTTYVNGAEYVMVGYGLFDDNYKKANVYFTKLAKGSTSPVQKILPGTESLTKPDCRMVFDKTAGKFYIIVESYEGYSYANGKSYSFAVMPLDPAKMEYGKSFTITSNSANSYYKTKSLRNQEYTGLPQKVDIDAAGNIVIQSENVIQNQTGVGTYVELHDIAVTSMTKDGKENYGFVVAYHNSVSNDIEAFNYMDNRKGIITHMTYSYFIGTGIDVAVGKKYNYMFLNNTPTEFKMADYDPYFPLLSFKEPLMGVFYKIDTKTGTVTKGVLFDTPQNNADASYGHFDEADYDSETGVYSTLVTDRINGKLTSRVAWITLE